MIHNPNPGRNPPIPSKPPLGPKPAWISAWQRIGELIAAIERQYESPDGSEHLCKAWAQEIVMQCNIIEEYKRQEGKHE